MDNKTTILIVDDDLKFRKTLSDILRAKGYSPLAAAKGKTALSRVKKERPAVALIDLKLPDMDGLELMGEIKKRSPDTECIVLTGYASQASATEAVNLGAYSYMRKPYDVEQLVVTIQRAVEKREAQEALKGATVETVEAVSSIVEASDPYTAGHSARVTELALEIATEMGLGDGQFETLRIAGLLHDVGKVGIPGSVLNKPAKLTQAEWLMIQAHPVVSAEMSEQVTAFREAVPVIRHHHERWDGSGYPDGLKGEDIPLMARILAVADGFEAMTSERPYRSARTDEEALAELQKGAGTQWDPGVVKVFFKLRKPPTKRKGKGKRKGRK